MTIHVKFHEDSDGSLVDIDWYCSEYCYRAAGHTEVGAWPCGEESDSCTYCAHCEDVVRHGITDCDHCPECGIDNGKSNKYCVTCFVPA